MEGRFGFSIRSKHGRVLNYFLKPLRKAMVKAPPPKKRGNKPVDLDFEDMLNALVFYHLEEHTSGRHLLQVLEEDDFARRHIAPPGGIKKSTFFEAINTRGLEQMRHVFQTLQEEAANSLPKEHIDFGDLLLIDGSLIDATLSMQWADYTKDANKAKVHLGFNINQSIPTKLYFSDGNGNEKAYADLMMEQGQTGVMDRGYISYPRFDQWQRQEKHYVCRIRPNCRKTILHANRTEPDDFVFYDAMVLLGRPGINQTERPHRVVGYRVDDKDYWIATDRFDLSAEQIAQIYKLRWSLEIFFGWWKRHLRVYHILARSAYGFQVQILAGLITYLLLAIYCRERFNEPVSIRRVRQLRNDILNETRDNTRTHKKQRTKRIRQKRGRKYAKT